MNCHEQYTKVSPLLGNELDKVLADIEHFYYSDFWNTRFKRRLKEEKLEYNPIELDIIQGTTSELREQVRFRLFVEDENIHGTSNYKNEISLNVNSDLKNTIMHEFGHRQYNQSSFRLIIKLNKKIIGEPEFITELSDKDKEYFSNDDEIRQRIIPIIKEMRDNKWNLGQTYDSITDSIKEIFTREYILKLIDNLL